MDLNQRKISANETIKLMIMALNMDRISDAYQVADNYSKTLSYNVDSAKMINSALRQKPVRLMMLNNLSAQLKNLLLVEDKKEQHVFVDNDTRIVIDSLKKEWVNIDLFRQHNLTVRNKILLHGPTGNGKTTIARFIAKESGLPFVQINSDMVIDSKLGSTMTNIHLVLNQIKEPSVLFWDEIDSVGRKRGNSDGSSSSLENERMVNSILVNLEKLDNTVILIAATNRVEVLDSAFLRRFNLIHEIGEPSNEHKIYYAESLCEYFNIDFPGIDASDFTNLSEIRELAEKKAREHVLSLIK